MRRVLCVFEKVIRLTWGGMPEKVVLRVTDTALPGGPIHSADNVVARIPGGDRSHTVPTGCQMGFFSQPFAVLPAVLPD